MALPTPGPSSGKKCITYIPKTAPEKLRILRRVAAKVSDELRGKFGKLPKAIEFTGLADEFIETLRNEQSDHIEIKIREVDRSVVYHELMDLYLKEKTMPTTYQLFLKVQGSIPAYMDLGEFRNYIFKNGFMWKQIIKGTCVVIENPKITFERYLYLKNIIRHRKEGKTIFFVDEVAFDGNGDILTIKQSISRKDDLQIRLIYVVTNEGVQFKQFINEFNTEAILKFMKETLLKTLSVPSVIVLNNYKHHCAELLALPNEDSLKKDMCAWLEHFDVPHDPELPKALLFELIQKYTDLTQKMYVVDNMLRQHGHTVLRLPDCIIKLTPATYYFDMLRANMPDLLGEYSVPVDPDVVKTSIDQIMDTLNEEYLSAYQYSGVIVEEELAVFMKDAAVDNMMDELEDSTKQALAENNGLDSDVPSNDSDSD